MAESAIGAVVRYCGHRGTFIADIWVVGNVNVVHAAGPITMDNLNRNEHDYERATHQLYDSPVCGFWRPAQAVFVVPTNQVRELHKE